MVSIILVNIGIMENQTEKNMEHEMETGKYLIQGGIQGRSMVYKRIHIGDDEDIGNFGPVYTPLNKVLPSFHFLLHLILYCPNTNLYTRYYNILQYTIIYNNIQQDTITHILIYRNILQNAIICYSIL